jgi:hypothetical protein
LSVATEKARIADICETIAGIGGAGAMPRNLADANLPYVVVLTGEATRQRDDNLISIERIYRLALLVKSWAEGVETEAEGLCEPFFPLFEDAFLSRPSLQLADNTTPLAGVQNADLGNDTASSNTLAGVGQWACSSIIRPERA